MLGALKRPAAEPKAGVRGRSGSTCIHSAETYSDGPSFCLDPRECREPVEEERVDLDLNAHDPRSDGEGLTSPPLRRRSASTSELVRTFASTLERHACWRW